MPGDRFFLALIAPGFESRYTSACVSVSFCRVDCVMADAQMWDWHQEVNGLPLC